ncbi:MAG: hypothetical protein SF339_08740 [Blastocatellia bacterium]|nr:hypothetical protein [Blastocatellia bacterium]
MMQPERNLAPVFKIVKLSERQTDLAYWKGQSFQARLAALEQLRQEYHRGKHNAESRLQRVYRIVDSASGCRRLQDLADVENLEG